MLPGDPAVLVGPVQVVVGVGLRRSDLEDISTRGFCDVVRHGLRIAGGGVVHHQHIAAVRRSVPAGIPRGGGVRTCVRRGRRLLLGLFLSCLVACRTVAAAAGRQGQRHGARQQAAEKPLPSLHKKFLLSDRSVTPSRSPGSRPRCGRRSHHCSGPGT